MKVLLILSSVLMIHSSPLLAKTLQVMSYNVENLFDVKHDVVNGKEKKDWTFLPKDAPGKKEACNGERSKHHRKECLDSDWTESKLAVRISQINDVVTKKQTILPDFLGLIEVENSNVLTQLAKSLGYENFEVTESPDERGIDVALMYKTSKDIKKISRNELLVVTDYPTRNILEVEFLIEGKYPLTIFVNHWPSLANPDSWRVKAAEVLAARTRELMLKTPNMAIMAMGDFNTIDDNSPHPFKTVLYKDGLYHDVFQAFADDKTIDAKIKKSMPEGTYYFSPKDQWNFLDHIFINSSLNDGKDIELNTKSFEIYSPAFLTYDLKKKFFEGEGTNFKIVVVPKRFESEGTTKETIGYSDHFPILAKLEYPAEVAAAPVAKAAKKKTKAKKK